MVLREDVYFSRPFTGTILHSLSTCSVLVRDHPASHSRSRKPYSPLHWGDIPPPRTSGATLGEKGENFQNWHTPAFPHPERHPFHSCRLDGALALLWLQPLSSNKSRSLRNNDPVPPQGQVSPSNPHSPITPAATWSKKNEPHKLAPLNPIVTQVPSSVSLLTFPIRLQAKGHTCKKKNTWRKTLGSESPSLAIPRKGTDNLICMFDWAPTT